MGCSPALAFVLAFGAAETGSVSAIDRETASLELARIVVVDNPRRRFDEASLGELAASIERHGLLQPIAVRPMWQDEAIELGRADDLPGLYELVAGERRLRAIAMLANEAAPEIRAEVLHISRAEAQELRLVENLQREDLHPLDEAGAFRALLKAEEEGGRGWTLDEHAQTVHRSRSYIYQRLKLADLTEPIQDAFFDGELTAGHAILFARLQPADQEGAFEAYGEAWNGPMSVRQLSEFIQYRLHRRLEHAPFDPKDADLHTEAGACTVCPKRSGYEPDLFPDIESADVCTDQACFERKVDLKVEAQIAKLKTSGNGFLQLSENWQVSGEARGERKKILSSDHWTKARKKDCPHTQRGIVVDGARLLGKVLWICASKECDVHVHRHSDAWAPSPEEKLRRAKEKRAGRVKKKRGELLLEAVVAELPARPDRATLLWLLPRLIDEIWSEHRAAVVGLTRKEFSKAKVAETLDAKKLRELWEVLYRVALVPISEPGFYSTADELAKLAKELGVDVAAIGKTP